jgi:hypothetical protein
VQSDVNERVLESRHRLEADIRPLLRDVAHVAERALAHARAAQRSGAAGVQSALTRFDHWNGKFSHSWPDRPPLQGVCYGCETGLDSHQ